MADTHAHNKEFVLRPDERVDDLGGDVKILLSDSLPKFTGDALLLSRFAAGGITQKDRVVDLGSGTGIIALMIYSMTRAQVLGIEFQEELYDLSLRSCLLNGLNSADTVSFINMDYTEAYKQFNGAFTVGVSNPPYFPSNRTLRAQNTDRALSRSMPEDGIIALIQAAARLIKSGGRFFMCYPVEGLVDALCALREYKLEPKRIRLIKSKPDASPYLALIDSKRDGGRGLSIECVSV